MLKKTLLFIFSLFITITLLSNQKTIDVAVIGGGCAGLSAAAVTSEYDLETEIFEGPYVGGVLNVKTIVGNWPGKKTCFGNEIIPDLQEKATRFGAKIRNLSVKSCDFSVYPYLLHLSNDEKILARSIIIATGTKERELNIKGYDQYLGKGIFTNDIIYSDLREFDRKTRSSKVLIIGGGIDAAKKGVYTTTNGATEALVVIKDSVMKITPQRRRVMEKFSRIKILPQAEVLEFHGTMELEAVTLKTPEKIIKLDVNQVIISIGRVPNSSLFKGQLEMDEKGIIALKENSQKTSQKGVFAAGDVTKGFSYGQGAIAAGDGMKAGYDAVNFLQDHDY